MDQVINVRYLGFVIGKYTYFAKKKSLYRQNVKNGIIKLKMQLHGGSLGYDIQGKFYKKSDLQKMWTNVEVKEITPF